MKKYIYLILLVFSAQLLIAADEKARALVHSLSYIEGDYGHAVENGKVLSEVEYAEMVEFSESIVKLYPEVASNLPASDTANLSQKVNRLFQAIQQKASKDSVCGLAQLLKNELIQHSKLSTAPREYPNISKGEMIYQNECAKCHGKTGYGDGPDGKGAVPLPRNFNDEERMNELSPFAIFNTVRLGIKGTLMKPHPTLSDKEVWDVSFYVLTLASHEDNLSSLPSLPDISLNEIASSSNTTLSAKHNLSKAEIIALRHQQPSQANNAFLNIAISNLDSSFAAYQSADYEKSLAWASTAYLDGIEALESSIKASDPKLAEQLEKDMMHVRKLIKQQATEKEVEQAIATAKLSINKAAELLEKKEYSFAMAFWMTVAILLREGLEAFLVIMAILAVLNKTNLRHRKKFVHAGWISSILVGFVLWFASGKMLSVGFAKIELLEGLISITAVVMLLYIGFWLHGKANAEAWKNYVSELVKSAAGNGSALGLGAIAFFVVFREVFESVLFLSALNIESKGTQTLALGIGFLAALAIVLLLAIITLKFSAKLPIPKLFKVSSAMMSLLAVVLTGKGVKAFQEVGIMDSTHIPFFKIELLGIFPSVETLAAQLATVLLVAILWSISNRNK